MGCGRETDAEAAVGMQDPEDSKPLFSILPSRGWVVLDIGELWAFLVDFAVAAAMMAGRLIFYRIRLRAQM